MKYTCKQCGKEFEITEGEAEFYRSKGLNLPKRCKECREKNKAEKSKETASAPEPVQRNTPKKPERETYSGGGISNKALKIAISVVVAIFAVIVGLVSMVSRSSYKEDNSDTSSYEEYDGTVVAEEAEEGQTESLTDEQEPQTAAANTTKATTTTKKVTTTTEKATATSSSCRFRNDERLQEHFQKHGSEVGASSAEEYQRMAASVITSSRAQHKTEAEDGDDIYFIASTGEIVFVSGDGYIRTYFIADQDYFDRQ